ncbi:ankyrin repeat-containing domain protein [Aspergillus bertholletiae]|uniref:Ankyrin repeat-containing domain protein n=1 Tax=Aspergillus bertholletiae TaxID=1226010 RepID=A0A5N7B436_9EURO|nr:ankyrin repeat-containing domain protein [Aspergillus bertholletiae]
MRSDYCVKDLNAIVELADTVRKQSNDAPAQYDAGLDDVKRLQNMLRESEDRDLDDWDPVGDHQSYNEISKGCHDLLHDLNAYLGHVHATETRSHQGKGESVDCKITMGDVVLLRAAKHGFEEIVRFLLQQGVTTDPKDRAGRTPLHHAVALDHKEVVEILLAAGGDIETTDLADHIPLRFAAPCGSNKRNRSGHTPLISAIEAGNETMVQFLLEAGADPNHSTDNYAPLRSAIRAHDMTIFKMLLDKVSDLDCVDGRGETLLMHAAGWHDGMGELLLARGVRLDVENKYGETAMSIAAQRVNEPLLRLLLEKIPGQEYVNAKGRGLLHFAAKSNLDGGDEAMVRFLLARDGLTHDRKVADAQSGLHGAAWQGYTNILDILLGIDGVDVDDKDEDGYTPLWLAVRWGRKATVELLLDKYQANIEVSNGEMEWTSLHGAVYHEEPETARMLLARGANPNSIDRHGRTPLSWATNIVWQDCHDGIVPPMVPLLLETDGVDLNIPDTMGRTPLFWALLSAIHLVHSPEMVDMYDANVQLLLQKGARIDCCDKSGRTPIFYAAMMKRAGLVHIFLDKGAEPDCKDTDGRTPLSYAVEPFDVTWLAELKNEEGEWEPEWSSDQMSRVVQVLLAQGADPICPDPKGLTPLSRAEKRIKEGDEALVMLRNASSQG